MPLTLYDAIVPGFLQTIGAVQGLLDKAEAHIAAGLASEGEVLGARLAPDMLPFAYQVKSVWAHSAYAVERWFDGAFSPHTDPAPQSLAGLRDLLASAATSLSAV